MMEPFNFLLGDWNLEYQIPKSPYYEACTGTGHGKIQKFLNDQYVTFDYESQIQGETGKAHGIFAWDDSVKLYRYWWFESSGHFQAATCKFVNPNTLFMNWHDTVLTQTFRQTGPDEVVLDMGEPNEKSEYRSILRVIMKRA